ncbi:hypothetical protein [Gibbsiella quercinecans]|uniref:hypothetical protein n=1 Tax=Gibbsiella quercinecans TaxID=929813 RepID=UPI00242F9251|nr:hypothetical protein [Gibbsiella quercinecans]
MTIKISNIMKHYQAHGKVIVKLNPVSGTRMITVSKGARATNIVGVEPGGRLHRMTCEQVEELLEENRIYIEGWK